MHSQISMRTTLTVENPINITNYDEFCLDRLTSIYKNTCYLQKFILSIDELIYRSPFRINRVGKPGSANVDVQFKATVKVLPEGTVINNCKVIKIERNVILLEKDNIKANCKGIRCVYFNGFQSS